MKIAVINGSARKGNTFAALQAFCEGAEKNHDIEIICPDQLNLAPCKGCGACECYKGCAAKDDTNQTVDKIVSADMILFATPVYWWGMSAQMKLVIDKCYCKGAMLKGKKIGIIITGGSPVEAEQYRLINEQFGCMAKYLSWDILFSRSYYAVRKEELAASKSTLEELKKLGEEIGALQ